MITDIRKAAVIGGILDDVSPTAASENLPAAVRITPQRALHVNLRDDSGNALTPGGTQYTEGDTDATITGTAMLGKNGGPNYELRVPLIDNNDYLMVSVADILTAVEISDGGSSITVDGNVGVTPGSGNWDDASIHGVGAGQGLSTNASTAGFSDGTDMQMARVYDLDTGAGTEYALGVQVRAAASGGSVAVGGDATNGLDVDVTRSALPTGAATSANQTSGGQKTQIVDADGDTLDLWHSGDTYTAAADHGIMVLARSGETPNKYRPLKIETAGADGESNTNDRLVCESYLAMYNGSTWDRVRGDTTYGLDVDITRTAASDNFDPVIGKTGVIKCVDFTASQTAQTIWDPTNGTKFVITDIEISFSAAGTITVFDDTDATTSRVGKWYGAANGGMVHAYRKPRISATADNILKYTTGAGAAGSVTVWGYEV